MRILVTYGSRRGGTQGLAEMVADDLRTEGFDVDLLPPSRAMVFGVIAIRLFRLK